LNGFFLMGGAGSLDGINATGASPVAAGLIVRNGTIENWGNNGINTQSGAPGAHFSRLILMNNAQSGLRAIGAVVSDCVSANNTSGNANYYGIHAIASRVVNCVARGNSNGIQGSAGSTVESCVATDNGFGFLGDNSTFLHCTAYNGSAGGMFLFSNNYVSSNLLNGNGHGIGITVASGNTGNTIDSNMLIGNPTAGIKLDSATSVINNFVLRNFVRGATTNNFLMGTGNSFGPIINVAGAGDISGTTGANHPWANFSY
jgi:hypothetical protein